MQPDLLEFRSEFNLSHELSFLEDRLVACSQTVSYGSFFNSQDGERQTAFVMHYEYPLIRCVHDATAPAI
jgi:hypothetical protein